MFKILKILFLFLFTILKSYAQVVLTIKDVPPFGTNIIFANVKDTESLNNFKFNKTGINNFWDFSVLSLNYNDTIKLLSPSQTPYNLNFYDADLAFGKDNGLEDIYFQKADSTGYYEVGYSSHLRPCPFYQALRYNKPYLVFPFPAKYPYLKLDTTYIRTKNYLNNTNDSAYCEEYIFSTKEIVATGTIKFPFGLFESFLLKTIFTYWDTTWIKGKDGKWNSEINSLPGRSVVYDWYCNKSTFYVARISPTGFDNIDFLFIQMNNFANLKSVSVNDFEQTKINIYPNPASSTLFVENLNLKNNSYIITDISGREIKKDNLSDEINIEVLQLGMYIISLYNQNELIGRKKFVKH